MGVFKCLFIFLIVFIVSGCGYESKATIVTHVSQKYQVDLNSASKSEIEDMLHGVGPVTANKIIASRNSKPFKSIYDLRERNIIGKELFSNIKGDIKIGTTINKHSGRIANAE